MNKLIVILSFLISYQLGLSQKDISLKSIWKDDVFTAQSIPGFNFLKDGRHYTRLENNTIKKYDIITGEWVENIFEGGNIRGREGFEGNIEGYAFNEDETILIISSRHQKVYRRSFLAKFHVYNLETDQLTPVHDNEWIFNATLSPDAQKIGYVYHNNLYYQDISTREVFQITQDGNKNEVINGITDWVYEEEFAIVKAFWWSPDNEKLAYLRFDETRVPEFQMTYYTGAVYPEYQKFKYPKVGEKNAEVSVHIYKLSSAKSLPVDIGDLDDRYIPRVSWTTNGDELCVFKMNRHQNHLMLYLAYSDDRPTRVMYEEKSKYYVPIDNNLTFLKDNDHFIWTSEKSGFNHIYLVNKSDGKSRQLTKGNFDVTAFYGIDETNDVIYYQAAKSSPLEKQIFETQISTLESKPVADGAGTNSAQFSSTFDYFVLNHSRLNTPPSYVVCDRTGRKVRSIEENKRLQSLQEDHEVQPLEFFSFETSENVELNGWMLKPADFNPNRQYPVFMYQYSGPGSQSAGDSWMGTRYWWFQLLAEQGYIVACVDGRGTGNRGEEFKKMTYLQLGHYETKDQIEAAKYLGSLPYTDASRIGIFGWSYGGYMSSLCILKGNDVFSTAIAVAPVTSWKWYDTIYTERYMRTTKENPDGYAENSPVNFAHRLRGKYLLVHGGTDDNVHLQNSMEMSRALISANKQFDSYIYPNRNHGIYGDNARWHLYTKMTDFLQENLMNGSGLKELKP